MYQQLCSNVDTIVHNGALVNHAYSYEQLFEPNVLGTVEVRLVMQLSFLVTKLSICASSPLTKPCLVGDRARPHARLGWD